MASPEKLTVDGSFSPQAGTSQVHNMPVDASPDSKCSICLDRFNKVSHLDPCGHRFCFDCIQEWTKTKAECPLCKQPFRFNFHSVQDDDDNKEYILNGIFARPDGNQFQYCTTFTGNCSLPTHPLTSSSSHTTFMPPDNRILFDGHLNQTSLQRGGDIYQMIQRLASSRQASAEGRFMKEIPEDELINFRRALYHHGLRVRNIQGGDQYRDISAQFFRRNPASLHHLLPWLKRELTVLFGINGSLPTIVQHIIISNVTQYDMGSQAFVEDLRPFLQHHTDHFLHELINFARCPYNVEAYDQNANYDCPTASYEDGSCSGPAQSSIITISSDDEDIRETDVPSSAFRLSQSPWDNETPGTSYSTLEQATATDSTTLASSESSDDESFINEATTQVDINMDTIARMQDIEAYDQHTNYDCPAQLSIITITSDEEDVSEPDVPSSALGLGQTPWANETAGTFYSTLAQATAAASTALASSESSDDESFINGATTQVDINMDTIARMQDIEAYVQHTNYDCPAQLSIITITSDEEDVSEPDVPSSAFGLGQTPWANETAGTFYSTLEQATATASTALASSESLDDESFINRATTQMDINMDTIARMQDIEVYDQHTNHDCPAQSSIITITSDEEDVSEQDVPSSALGLGLTPWANDTSGTSYSTLEQATATALANLDSSERLDEEPFINRATTQVDINTDTVAIMQDSRSSHHDSFTLVKEKYAQKASHKDSTSSDEHCYSKKKEKRKRPVDVSSQNLREEALQQGQAKNQELQKSREEWAQMLEIKEKIQKQRQELVLEKEDYVTDQ
ncbi:uncharacterized protein LOC142487815 [Ascaphus truei]|uniref:uncharacterized protein LOC142487815 n=1 Tax=Ascaphus truei TaxID=8439 RepID=UPI003F5AA10A